MKKYFIFAVLTVLVVFCAQAKIQIKQNNFETSNNSFADTQIDADEAKEIEILKEDIRILDEELAKCKKQKKAWTAATIIGGVGVLTTGVTAIVQNEKIKDNKSEIQRQKNELKDKERELKNLQNQ